MKDQYLLQDGTYADPADVKKGENGVLRHNNGVPVAIKDDGKPHTLADTTRLNTEAANAGKPEAAAAEAAPRQDRQVKAGDEGDPNYKTR